MREVSLQDSAVTIDAPPPQSVQLHISRTLFYRIGLIALVLGLEWLPVSARISTGRGGQSLARALVTFLFFFFTFGYFKVRGNLSQISHQLAGKMAGAKFLAAHAIAMLAFLGLSAIPQGAGDSAWKAVSLSAAWYLSGLSALALCGFAFIPPRFWLTLVRCTGRLWIFAAASAGIAWYVVSPLWSAWDETGWKPGIGLTFALTAKLLKPLLPNLIVDRANLLMGTPQFGVQIGGACSGVEGAGLMLVFSVAWLWLFRAERRFPQALLVVPLSMAVMWLLNAVRLAVLILIGNAGAPKIAMGGFHSQAGWITFNIVALCVVLIAGKIRWWSTAAPVTEIREHTVNPTAGYVAPFLVILAAAMISRAGSSDFEWLYPIRFLAAAAALWSFRARYADLDWRCSWYAPVAGAVVFLIWVSFAAFHGSSAGAMPVALAAALPLARTAWIACRVLAAVITVPVAEELAFRGFLLRRLISADFETLDPRTFTWVAVLVSSGVFGVLHGSRWIEGSAAGFLYAFALLRRGRIGDAVAAHAVTNALIAITVLFGGKWGYW